MNESKVEWKLIQVKGHELESALTELSNSDYEIFTVQFTGAQWSIVARKFPKGSTEKSMGFRSPSPL